MLCIFYWAIMPLSGCATYDLGIENKLERGKDVGIDITFGDYSSMGGGRGRITNVGISQKIPDTANVIWYTDIGTTKHERKIPVSPLPFKYPWERYYFLFSVYPGDSAGLQIQVLKHNDCSHIYGHSAAYIGSSPCSW